MHRTCSCEEWAWTLSETTLYELNFLANSHAHIICCPTDVFARLRVFWFINLHPNSVLIFLVWDINEKLQFPNMALINFSDQFRRLRRPSWMKDVDYFNILIWLIVSDGLTINQSISFRGAAIIMPRASIDGAPNPMRIRARSGWI